MTRDMAQQPQGPDEDACSVKGWVMCMGHVPLHDVEAKDDDSTIGVVQVFLVLGTSPRDPRKYERLGLLEVHHPTEHVIVFGQDSVQTIPVL